MAENLLPLEKLCVDTGKRRVISRNYKILIDTVWKDWTYQHLSGNGKKEVGTQANDLENRQLLRRYMKENATGTNK